LLKVLSDFTIEDVTIKEPDLEEIFMHYYQEQKPGEPLTARYDL